MPYTVSKDRFCQLVEEAIEELPPPFDRYIEEVSIEVHDSPTRAQLKEAGLGPRDLLLGLYVGRPLTERHVEDGPALPDRIFIFQSHVQQVCENEDDLVDQVRTTVLHEIGHHFGMDEDDLDELGYG